MDLYGPVEQHRSPDVLSPGQCVAARIAACGDCIRELRATMRVKAAGVGERAIAACAPQPLVGALEIRMDSRERDALPTSRGLGRTVCY